MTTVVIKNGVTKLIICPQTEIEKLLLKELFEGPVDVVYRDKMQVDDKNMVDSYVILPATTKTV